MLRRIIREDIVIATNEMGVPPALPGRHAKFDRYGSPSKKLLAEAAKHTQRRNWMDEYESLSHSKWECKYHVVFIAKGRRKALYGDLRKYLGEVFRKLAEQKESRIEEGHLLPDHVHMMISIPPKYAVAQVIGFIKGKSAIHLA